MGRMNRMRVYLGGVVAGVFIFCADYVLHGLMLKADWDAAMTALGKTQTPENMASSMGLFAAQSLVVGVAVSWVYAAIRPRFGAGAGTAVRGGIWVWVMASLSPTLVNTAMGLLPSKLLMTPLVGDLIIIVLASVLAGAIYKEAA
jgi:hypothetical protein